MSKKVFLLIFVSLLLGANLFSSVGRDGLTIPLAGNGEPWTDSGNDTSTGSRSLPILPFSAYVVNNQTVKLDFYEAIGEITITISASDGQVLYQTLENITSPQVFSILVSNASDEYLLLEIKNNKGAYASGTFLLTY